MFILFFIKSKFLTIDYIYKKHSIHVMVTEKDPDKRLCLTEMLIVSHRNVASIMVWLCKLQSYDHPKTDNFIISDMP